jgi:hypothetical protein
MNKTFFKTLLFAIVAVLFASCDKDFNELGSDIIGDDHFGFELYDQASVSANNFATGPVQSNNLDVNPLGIYNNPAFGRTTANFVTQLEMATPNPTFHTYDNEPVVDSVILTIPYYSTVLTSEASGAKTYELDSIYGTSESRMKLSIFRSNFFLQDIDHDTDGTQVPQRYYTDQNAAFDSGTFTDATRLNNSTDPSQNDQFYFSNEEFVETTTDIHGNDNTTHTAPQMRLKLDVPTFQQLIVNAATSGNLQNNNVFKNYFRGLYFKVEAGSDPGQLAMLNFKAGKITINYREDTHTCTTTDNVTTCVNSPLDLKKQFVLNLTGNTVSLLSNSNESAQYINAISQAATAAGADRLYLKGGEGSVATIDLFGAADLYQYVDSDNNSTTPEVVVNTPNGVPDELDDLRQEKWLINEANLTFYVDQTAMGSTFSSEPNRLYLYDINNKRPLVDYVFDNSSGSGGAKFNKIIYGGIIEREDVSGGGGRGIKYRVRITNYVRDLVTKDSTNVKLGLAVTESINISSMSKLKTANPTLNDFIPTGSVMNPLGTILYGSSFPDEDKKLKLQIYYTKPN